MMLEFITEGGVTGHEEYRAQVTDVQHILAAHLLLKYRPLQCLFSSYGVGV